MCTTNTFLYLLHMDGWTRIPYHRQVPYYFRIYASWYLYRLTEPAQTGNMYLRSSKEGRPQMIWFWSKSDCSRGKKNVVIMSYSISWNYNYLYRKLMSHVEKIFYKNSETGSHMKFLKPWIMKPYWFWVKMFRRKLDASDKKLKTKITGMKLCGVGEFNFYACTLPYPSLCWRLKLKFLPEGIL